MLGYSSSLRSNRKEASGAVPVMTPGRFMRCTRAPPCRGCFRQIYPIGGSQKSLRTQDADILHGGYLVGIVEARVDNGNRHSLSLEAFFVQLIAIAQPYLVDSQSINAVGMHARAVYQRVAPVAMNGPSPPGAIHTFSVSRTKRQSGNALHQCRVVAGHCNKNSPTCR